MKNYDEMYAILSDIRSEEIVNEMKHYIHHGNVTIYEHCEHVARLCYDMNRSLKLNSDLRVLLVGAMLHDFYLYDWHRVDDGSHRLHGYRHAATACRNAKKYFDIDDKIYQVIYSHMWPLNLGRIPQSKEAWILCLSDKCVSLYETLRLRSAGQ